MDKEEVGEKGRNAGGDHEEPKQEQQQRLVEVHQRPQYYQQQPRAYPHQFQGQHYTYEYPSYPDWVAMQHHQVYHHYG